MAEALARAFLRERLQAPGGAGGLDLLHFGFELSSLGVYAASGAPASSGALEVLAERGIDLSAHRSRPAQPEALARCDRIYCLTQSHLDALRALLPPVRHAPLELLDPGQRDIVDPHGNERAAYQRSLAEIERALRQRLDEWA
jgi:protein-tyrosine phosphatase